MRHAPFVLGISFSALVVSAVAAGCGSGSGTGNGDCPAGETCTPACPAGEVCTPADGGGGTTGDGSPVTSGGDSGGTLPAGCTDGGPADDDPVCNACVYAHCCKQVDDCANDPNCVAIEKCESACDPSDFTCLGDCTLTADTTTLEAVGNCAQQDCPTECAGSEPDASFDFDAF
jgi:hypothetical protein